MRTRMSGGVGAGRAILPATRFENVSTISKISGQTTATLRGGRSCHGALKFSPRNTQNTRNGIFVSCAKQRGLKIQQEVTEETEDRSHLCVLRCLLFKSPLMANDQLSHAGPETLANPRLPGKPKPLPGVG